MDTGRIMHEQSANTELIRCFTIMPGVGRVITGSYSNQIRVSPHRADGVSIGSWAEVSLHYRSGLYTRFENRLC